MNIIKESPILHAETRTGKKKYWQGFVIENMGDYFTQTCYWQDTADGESTKQYSEAKYVKPTNIGRANEKNSKEQALFNLESMIAKQNDKGYSGEGVEKKVLPTPMLANKWHDKKHTVDFPVCLQPKLDGCVHGDTLIATDAGYIKIKDLVSKRMPVKVLTRNETSGKLEYKEIVNYFDNGKAEMKYWMDIKPEFGPFIKCTTNHKILTNFGWIEAENLNPKNHMVVCDKSSYLNSLITGTLLGDSALSIDKRSKLSYRLIFSHSNMDYFHFKVDILGLDGTKKDYITGYGSNAKRFVSTALTKTNFPIELFYDIDPASDSFGKRKVISCKDLEKLMSNASLSLWIADDGNIAYNNGNTKTPRLTISTHRYPDEQIEEFIKFFIKAYGCTPSIYTDKRVDTSENCDGRLLVFSTKDTLYILNMLTECHCQGVEYKYYFSTDGYIKEVPDGEVYSAFKATKSRNMAPSTKYDLEIEGNHNYLANGIWVHNCRMLFKDGIGWSRMGKPIIPEVIDHIGNDSDGLILDGELIYEGASFQDTVRAIKKFRPEMSPKLTYHVFDVIKPDMPFVARYELLEDFFRGNTLPEGMKLVPTIWGINDEADIMEVHGYYTQQGYEGTIIRTLMGHYQIGQRSSDLLKLKDFDDAEFGIIGVDEGEGKDAGAAIFICALDNGGFFSVRPKGTIGYRREIWDDAASYIGRMLTVRYQGFSEDGVPRFPIGIAVRDEIQG